MILLTIVIGVILSFIAILLFGCLLFTVQYLWLYHCHRCKYCHHRMKFRGFKENEDESHYLFHCPECGAWEQIPKEEFFRHL
jgi:hypothetical protein